jgi:UDP-glucose 4-epimerase
MYILITGGTGYIGSHTAVQLLNAGYNVIILDSLINSSEIVIQRIEEITGKQPVFIRGDVRDSSLLESLFTKYTISAVIHFAGLKAVGESNLKPLMYYDANVNGSIQLIHAMAKSGVKKLVFSSSATVYGEEAPIPYIETTRRGTPSSPYGASKAIVEQILTDLAESDSDWSIVLLRYFNPIGAHPSGKIGEDPKGIPNNLMPFISQVAIGKREKLTIFGNDYTTKDGTCERDYLHILDLANGHLYSLEKLNKHGLSIFNLGTGKPASVLEMVKAFEIVNRIEIPYEISARREGDLPAFWADCNKARIELNWSATHTIDDMMRDTWNWQIKNPNGYEPD